MAEAFFKQLTNGKHPVQSAGIEAMGSDGTNLDGMLLKDRASSKYVVNSLQEVGIDVSNNRIKKLTPEMVVNATNIFILVKPETVPDFLKNSSNVAYWDIVDPDEQTLEFHRQTRDRIKELVKIFLIRNDVLC